MVSLPQNEEQTYRLSSRAQMWPSGLTLAMTLTLNFQDQINDLLYLSQKWSDCQKNEKQTYRFNSKASNVAIRFDLGRDLDLEFSRSNMEFPIYQQKVVRLPRNEKQTYQLNSRPQMWPLGLTLTITLTFEFWRPNVTLTFDQTHVLHKHKCNCRDWVFKTYGYEIQSRYSTYLWEHRQHSDTIFVWICLWIAKQLGNRSILRNWWKRI